MDERTEYQFRETMAILDAISQDLNAMLRITPIRGLAGNCNAPMALYALTSMSFLGYLIAEEKIELDDPVRLIIMYLEQAFLPADLVLFGHNAKDTISQLYFGLIHTFVPIRIGVDRMSGTIAFTWDAPDFNVQRLAIKTILSIKRLKGMMSDPELAARMWDRIMTLSFKRLEE